MPKFDVNVADAGLGALAAAALLAARGKKVLVSTPMPSVSEAMGLTETDGFRFSSGPSLVYGFEPGGAFQRFFHELGLHDMEPSRPAAYQVALPDRRITVFADRDKFREELRREFPGETTALNRFYGDLSKAADRISQSRIAAFCAKHRSGGAFIRKYRFSRELALFFDVQALYFFQRPCAELTLDLLVALCISRPSRIPGGYRELIDRVAEVVTRSAGDIRCNEAVTEVVYRRNRAVGIKTAQGAAEARKTLLCSSDRNLPTLFLGIKDEVVPVGMERDVLYLPDYEQPHDFLACSLSAKDDRSSSPQGMRALSVTFHTAHDRKPDVGAMADRVSGLVPFLKDFLVLTRQPRSFKTGRLTEGLTFKPVSSRGSEPLLFKTSKKNLYLLHDAAHAPLRAILEARRFVEKNL